MNRIHLDKPTASTAGEGCPFRRKDEESTIDGSASTTATVVAGCPYAQAMTTMQGNNNAMGCSSADEVASIPSHQLPPSLPGVLELRECPAFRNSTCPFKDAKSPEEISHKLSQIPSSHLQGTTHNVLLQTLAFYHNRNNNGHAVTTSSSAVSTCPVKGLVPKDWSFDRAMEDYSLASIMSSLAEEHEHRSEDIANKVEKALGDDHEPQVGDFDDSHRDENQSISSHDTLGSLAPPSSTFKDSPTSCKPLSEALKTGTAAAHEAAESVHFVKNFIRGKIDRDLYGLLIAQLYHVYKRLELLLNEHAPTHFVTCHFPRELERLPALKEDVDFWHSLNDTSTEEPPISPSTQDYLDRLDTLAKEDPLLLLAHAYTRYLGDLSGGKVLSRVARRALNLDKDGEGLAFYRFPLVESAKKFKDKYRQCLNELPLNDSQVQAMVKEANVAFLLNVRLFEELDVLGGVPGATVRDLREVYSSATNNAHPFGSNENMSDVQCPFVKTKVAGTGGPKSTAVNKKHGTCPWPFILLHDPIAGLKHHETWLVIIGVAVAYLYNKYMVKMEL